MKTSQNDIFDDISRLSEIYRSDPAAFEALRKQIIEEAIEQFPPQHRARAHGLQFRLDHELSLCKDPISRMNRMVELFWEGVRTFESVITNPDEFMEEKKRRRGEGEVIPFPGKKESLH